MSNIKAWPKPTGTPSKLPKPIVRPCDYGLMTSVYSLEMELGTIEAYNRLVAAAIALKKRIDEGDVKAQNPVYAKNPKG